MSTHITIITFTKCFCFTGCSIFGDKRKIPHYHNRWSTPTTVSVSFPSQRNCLWLSLYQGGKYRCPEISSNRNIGTRWQTKFATSNFSKVSRMRRMRCSSLFISDLGYGQVGAVDRRDQRCSSNTKGKSCYSNCLNSFFFGSTIIWHCQLLNQSFEIARNKLRNDL